MKRVSGYGKYGFYGGYRQNTLKQQIQELENKLIYNNAHKKQQSQYLQAEEFIKNFKTQDHARRRGQDYAQDKSVKVQNMGLELSENQQKSPIFVNNRKQLDQRRIHTRSNPPLYDPGLPPYQNILSRAQVSGKEALSPPKPGANNNYQSWSRKSKLQSSFEIPPQPQLPYHRSPQRPFQQLELNASVAAMHLVPKQTPERGLGKNRAFQSE